MSGITASDRRSERTAATRREILDAAWQLVREEGLAALAMRDLGARVGMRAQSLYGYFPSKHAIFDAMFADAYRQFAARTAPLDAIEAPDDRLRGLARIFVQFCVEDPVRHQLLFQRTIPGFEPSAESYQLAIDGVARARAIVRACGISSQRAFDVFVALGSGLAAQQNANEPGGRRWVRLVDETTDMFLATYREKTRRTR
jgi:AcrR family transcriptional regulator